MTLLKKNGDWNFPALHDFFGTDSLLDEWAGRKFKNTNLPAVNIKEDAKSYEIELAVPGMSKDNIKVELEDQILSISGEKKEEHEEHDKKYHRKEFSYGSFSRSFSLPDDASNDKIEARFNEGILKLAVPKKEGKAEEKKARVISVS